MDRPGPDDGVTMEIIEYTDPGCVWSWAAHPILAGLRDRLRGEPGVRWRRVFGIQLDGPPGGRGDAAAMLAGWQETGRATGRPITAVLEYAHVTTRPAAAAAVAAELQGPEVGDAVLLRLRESFFRYGRPADTPEAIAAALAGTPGLDLDRLLADADSAAVKERLAADWAETRDPVPEALAAGEGTVRPEGAGFRYVFPTVVLRGANGTAVLSGRRSLADYLAAVSRIGP